MKYLVSLLLVALVGHGADVAAQTQADVHLAPPPAALVLVLPDTKQALLKDQKRGIYVVVKVGDTFGGFRVRSIAAKRIVLSSVVNPSIFFVLPKLEPNAPKGSQPGQPAQKALADGAPRNPYAAPAPKPAPQPPAGTVVVNPYAPTTQPAAPAASPVAPPTQPVPPATPAQPNTTVAPPAAPPQTRPEPAPIPVVPTPAPQPAPNTEPPDLVPIPPPNVPGVIKVAPKPIVEPAPQAPTTNAAPAPALRLIESRTLPRAQLNRALADFDALAKQATWRKDPHGVRLAGLAQTSFFYRIGLRAGDVVVSVAGKPIRGVDDAAAVYATLLTAKTIAVQLIRGRSQVKLDYRVVD